MDKTRMNLPSRRVLALSVLRAIIRPGAETSGPGEKDDPEALSEVEQAQVARLRHEIADLKARKKQLKAGQGEAGFLMGSKIGHL